MTLKYTISGLPEEIIIRHDGAEIKTNDPVFEEWLFIQIAADGQILSPTSPTYALAKVMDANFKEDFPSLSVTKEGEVEPLPPLPDNVES